MINHIYMMNRSDDKSRVRIILPISIGDHRHYEAPQRLLFLPILLKPTTYKLATNHWLGWKPSQMFGWLLT